MVFTCGLCWCIDHMILICYQLCQYILIVDFLYWFRIIRVFYCIFVCIGCLLVNCTDFIVYGKCRKNIGINCPKLLGYIFRTCDIWENFGIFVSRFLKFGVDWFQVLFRSACSSASTGYSKTWRTMKIHFYGNVISISCCIWNTEKPQNLEQFSIHTH